MTFPAPPRSRRSPSSTIPAGSAPPRRPTARRGVGPASVLAVALTLAVVLGACSRSAATPMPTTDVGPAELVAGGYAADVCSLLSAQEIQSTTGLLVVVGRNVSPGQRDCEWYSDRGAITVTSLGGTSAFDGPRAEHASSPVSRLGDAAYWVGATDQLVVRLRDTVISVNVDLGDARVSYDDAVALAGIILPRL